MLTVICLKTRSRITKDKYLFLTFKEKTTIYLLSLRGKTKYFYCDKYKSLFLSHFRSEANLENCLSSIL